MTSSPAHSLEILRSTSRFNRIYTHFKTVNQVCDLFFIFGQSFSLTSLSGARHHTLEKRLDLSRYRNTNSSKSHNQLPKRWVFCCAFVRGVLHFHARECLLEWGPDWNVLVMSWMCAKTNHVLCVCVYQTARSITSNSKSDWKMRPWHQFKMVWGTKADFFPKIFCANGFKSSIRGFLGALTCQRLWLFPVCGCWHILNQLQMPASILRVTTFVSFLSVSGCADVCHSRGKIKGTGTAFKEEERPPYAGASWQCFAFEPMSESLSSC